MTDQWNIILNAYYGQASVLQGNITFQSKEFYALK